VKLHQVMLLAVLGLAIASASTPACAAAQSEPDEEAPPRPKLVIVQAGAPTPSLMTLPAGATVLRAEKPLPGAKRGTALRSGDVLQNGAAGNLDVRLGDVATLRLEAGARLRLSTLLRAAPGNPESRDTALKLEAGTLLVRLRALRTGSRFAVETPSAVITSTGGAFLTRVGKPGTNLLVTEGSTSVTSPSASTSGLTVSARQKTQVQKAIPERPDSISDDDRTRIDGLRQLAESIDAETEALLSGIDAHTVAGRFLEAERQADYAIGRAWGRPVSVRAHARYLDSARRRVGSVHLAGGDLLGFDQTVLAWYRGTPKAPETGLLPAVEEQFRTDPSARRWTLIWSATVHATSGSVENVADRILQLAAAEGADAVVRTECAALAGLAIQDRNERERTEDLLRQATILLESALSDPDCDQVLQMKVLAHLLFWPESRAMRTAVQRKADLERLLALGLKNHHGWGYYFAAGALQTLGREVAAAPLVADFFNDPLVRQELSAHPGFALPWVERLAAALEAKGEKHHAREVWRYMARRFENNPQILDRASEKLFELRL
jgi:hypothetical protein